MKENLAVAIVFAVALYCLMMIGVIANNVIIMTKRAKSLYSLEAPALARLKHKPTYQAILESNEGRLTMKRVETENLEKENI